MTAWKFEPLQVPALRRAAKSRRHGFTAFVRDCNGFPFTLTMSPGDCRNVRIWDQSDSMMLVEIIDLDSADGPAAIAKYGADY